jgi:hypothetical protein
MMTNGFDMCARPFEPSLPLDAEFPRLPAVRSTATNEMQAAFQKID